MKKPKRLQEIICFVLLAALAVCLPIMFALSARSAGKVKAETAVLTVWQIDSFEGGKGSRADFLQKLGDDFSKEGGCYVKVNSLSAEAARLNLGNGIVPDIISFGAGMYGLENYIEGYSVWCHGGYCLLTMDEGADFVDVSVKNTVINSGKDNLVQIAAAGCGITGADTVKSTGAYVKLINGNYKYLLGTQRDIFRLKTRGVSFKVKPLMQFNDLYQLISVTRYGGRTLYSRKFCDYVLSRKNEVNALGLLSESVGLYEDEMRALEGINYELKLSFPVSADIRRAIENAATSGDINMLKNLLK